MAQTTPLFVAFYIDTDKLMLKLKNIKDFKMWINRLYDCETSASNKILSTVIGSNFYSSNNMGQVIHGSVQSALNKIIHFFGFRWTQHTTDHDRPTQTAWTTKNSTEGNYTMNNNILLVLSET